MVHRHVGGAGGEDSEDRHVGLDAAAWNADAHPVAWPDAKRVKARGQRCRALVELGVGQRPVGGIDSQMPAMAGDRGREHIDERLGGPRRLARGSPAADVTQLPRRLWPGLEHVT